MVGDSAGDAVFVNNGEFAGMNIVQNFRRCALEYLHFFGRCGNLAAKFLPGGLKIDVKNAHRGARYFMHDFIGLPYGCFTTDTRAVIPAFFPVPGADTLDEGDGGVLILRQQGFQLLLFERRVEFSGGNDIVMFAISKVGLLSRVIQRHSGRNQDRAGS